MRIVFTTLFILINCVAYAQYENMLNKSFAEKRPLLVEFYENKLKIHIDSFSDKKNIIEELRAFGKTHKDKSLVAEATLAEAWLQLLESPGKNLQTGLMQDFVKASLKSKDYISATRAYRTLGDLYWQKAENYQLAFVNYLKNIEISKLLTEEEYPEKMVDYASIGYAFYFFKEYPQAIIYLKEGLKHKPPYKLARVQSDLRNSLGLYYQTSGNLDSSDFYFNEILVNETVLHQQWKGIANVSLGYNQFLRGDYEKAIDFLRQSMATGLRYNDYDLVGMSMLHLANIYLKQNKIAESERLAIEVRPYVQRSKKFELYELLYPLLSKLYSAKGDLKNGRLYLDSSLWAKDSSERKFSSMQLARAQQKIKSEQQQFKLAKLEDEKADKIWQRNVLIGFLIFLSAMALYIYKLIKRKHKQEQLLKDLYLDKKEKELTAAEKHLKSFTVNLQEKSRLLEELETQLELKGHEDEKLIEQLQQSTLLTDEQWNEFRLLFDQVHSGYLVRLKEKLPELTPGEIRYMALAKLHFNNKEMAAALGISQQTVRVTVHRLRKKLHFPEEGTLTDLIDSI